ncbi:MULTISPECIES: YqhA family protein [unclassified Mycobacterium]|uniref:YqhA family protein n=1 Tax=unclassified Mycobacterium TaxID=2642494 RepID=UPI000FAA8323|nr:MULTISPECIES: YqhA family protein [unclassified Mycobacterium]MDP7703666.1 YqhA family protein [Mycobacterium sp. TY815]MDP7722147.1 YqhA family protein [Mycobacterium sp. TY814]RUP06485.1 MAG: YqhA family protein [Mycobacterium sp.]
MRSVFEHLRFLIVIAVCGLAVTTAVTLLWASGRAVELIVMLAHGGWRQDSAVISLLEVVDLFLVATVQLIVALGLFELFVADLHLPEWLTVRNLGDLKRPIIQVLVVVVVIKFVERMLMTGALDTLYFGTATAVVTIALALFIRFGEHA